MQKLLAGLGAGASLLFFSNAALADGYSAPVGYERAFSWTGFTSVRREVQAGALRRIL